MLPRNGFGARGPTSSAPAPASPLSPRAPSYEAALRPRHPARARPPPPLRDHPAPGSRTSSTGSSRRASRRSSVSNCPASVLPLSAVLRRAVEREELPRRTRPPRPLASQGSGPPRPGGRGQRGGRRCWPRSPRASPARSGRRRSTQDFAVVSFKRFAGAPSIWGPGILRVESSWDRVAGLVAPKSRSGERSVPIPAGPPQRACPCTDFARPTPGRASSSRPPARGHSTRPMRFGSLAGPLVARRVFARSASTSAATPTPH